MRVPRECYQLIDELELRLPNLRPAQHRGLALWLWGTIAAGSACQVAVTGALLPLFSTEHAVRQFLREWLYDGNDRAARCDTRLDIDACFVWLLRWVVSWWRGPNLALAIDATTLQDRVAVLSVSVLYRGCAIPVAWRVLPANSPGKWIEPIMELIAALGPAVPPEWTVMVLTDRGLWSPRLWSQIRAVGWHPVMRIRPDSTFAPLGHPRRPARDLIPRPGYAWVGVGTAFGAPRVRRRATLVVVWEEGQEEPWIVLTDLDPEQIGVAWYGLRVWVEMGFRAIKSMGWQWERTRRSDPERVARHWLVLAVATLWVLAAGTRGEDAQALGMAPQHLRISPTTPPRHPKRTLSVFWRGLILLRWQWLRQRRLWRRHWLLPDAWPEPPPTLIVIRHCLGQETTHV